MVIDKEDSQLPGVTSMSYLDKNHEKLLFDKLEALLMLKQMCFLENSMRLVRKATPLHSEGVRNVFNA